MPRLETQINQIYLIHPETKKTSMVLYEESLNNFHHLFVLAELKDLQKKSEGNDLKKISEIILTSFRGNKKLTGEILFETALAQINQNLADLAHEGHKSWVGKFSALIVLKSGDNIYLANNGQTSAWLRRKSEMMEILKAEKRGTHPLKSFQNFTQGKIFDEDGLILVTASIFDYVSFELFTKILSQTTVALASAQISKILQDSLNPEQAFSGFFLQFAKKLFPNQISEPKAAAIYAPMPEEIEHLSRPKTRLSSFFNLWPKFRFPKFQLRWPSFRIKWQFFKNLTIAGKFFFISFTIFLFLFAVNITIYGLKLHGRNVAKKIDQQAAMVAKDLADLQSALIYKDDNQAFKLLTLTENDYRALKKLDAARIGEFSLKLEQLSNQVNKTSVINDPKIYAEIKHHPIYLAKSPTGFLLSAKDSNSVSSLDGTSSKDYFLLNSLKSDITGVSYWQQVGVAIATSNETFYIDQNLKQFESLLPFSNSSIERLKTYNNNLYALDTKGGKLVRITFAKKNYASQTIAIVDSNVRDFAIDKDIYLLSADKIVRITNGQTQAFPLPPMTDQITNATRIFVAGNLYILEPNKKRVVILSKSGNLINQIYFSSSTNPLDLYVDEGQRSLYLLDDNKLFRITF